MSPLRVLIILCFCCQTIYAQTNLFEGSVMYSDKKNLSASLTLSIDSSYQLSGELSRTFGSFTYKRYISGNFNPVDQTVYIREYALNSTDCPIFIQAKVNHIIENIYAIAGIFQALDTQKCPSGHINIICRNFKFNLYPKKQKPVILSEKTQDSILKTLLKKNLKEEKNFISMKNNDIYKLNSNIDTVYLAVYDNQKIDGDRVKIMLNEIVVIDNYPLSDEKKVFKLVLKKGSNKLNILATNEGRIDMNTSKVELYNHHFHEYFINVLRKNQSTTYEFIYNN